MLDCVAMSSRSRFRLWQLLAVCGVAVVLFALIDSWRLQSASDHQPTGSAEWIWGRRMEAPAAFFMVRDFEIAESVEPTAESAELQILADESYTAYLNGQRIGSNRYRAGAAVDRYLVHQFLRRGANRIAVLVDLTRLRGGLLARVVRVDADGSKEELVVTDEDWSVLPESAGPKFSNPKHPLRPLPTVVSLGRPPIGRWGWLKLGEHLRTLLPDQQLLRPDGTVASAARPASYRDRSGVWHNLPARARRRPLGDWVEFSWDQEQTGFFGIRHQASEPPVGLVYLGIEPPNPGVDAADLIVVGLKNRQTWEDSVVRRFRYALVLGIPSIVDARVHRTKPEVSELWERERTGVFSVAPPAAGARLRSAVEDEVWRRLEGISRAASGDLG